MRLLRTVVVALLMLTPSLVHADDVVTPEVAAGLASTMPRSALAGESVYFVMIDRYANGDSTNDRGGAGTGSGFNASDPAFYHGGDLAGLTTNLDRIRRLGFTAIWITPPFLNNTVQGSSAAYHGYWINDFTRIDPHFGTEADFAALVAKAHQLGLKVYLDIVMNHTGDVIRYRDGDAFGAPGSKQPYIPADLANAKAPAFLNDLANYHNQGSISNWNDADQARNGDFYGLDDIKTEQQAVVDGFAAVYANWVKQYGIDGFRIDTAKHVDNAFFGRWIPAFVQRAGVQSSAFAMFGEVYDAQPRVLAEYIRERGLPSVLDFALQPAVVAYAAGDQDASRLFSVIALDDLYNVGGDSEGWAANAYGLPVFGGNHDMGRTSMLIADQGGARIPKQYLPRVKLAQSLLFLLRGAPVLYYGDEVGMIGYSGDQGARQDMFPTAVTEWRDQDRVGAKPIGKGSSLTTAAERHPLAVQVASLNALRSRYAALRTGALLPRSVKGPVAAWSRIDATERREFVVLVNNSPRTVTARIPTSSPTTRFRAVLGSAKPVMTNAGAVMTIPVPALSTLVLRADALLPPATTAVPLDPQLTKLDGNIRAVRAVPRGTLRDPSSVTFIAQRCDTCAWERIVTDDAAPFTMVVPADLPANTRIAVITRSSSGAIAVGGSLRLSAVG